MLCLCVARDKYLMRNYGSLAQYDFCRVPDRKELVAENTSAESEERGSADFETVWCPRDRVPCTRARVTRSLLPEHNRDTMARSCNISSLSRSRSIFHLFVISWNLDLVIIFLWRNCGRFHFFLADLCMLCYQSRVKIVCKVRDNCWLYRSNRIVIPYNASFVGTKKCKRKIVRVWLCTISPSK